jgi:hypothetical protein
VRALSPTDYKLASLSASWRPRRLRRRRARMRRGWCRSPTRTIGGKHVARSRGRLRQRPVGDAAFGFLGLRPAARRHDWFTAAAGLSKRCRDPGRGAGTPLWKVLHDSPNADQSPTDYWEFASVSLDLRGNHYARIFRDQRGQLVALDPIRPDIMNVYRRPMVAGVSLVLGRQELRSRRGRGISRPRLRRRTARRLLDPAICPRKPGHCDRSRPRRWGNVRQRSTTEWRAEIQGVLGRRQSRDCTRRSDRTVRRRANNAGGRSSSKAVPTGSRSRSMPTTRNCLRAGDGRSRTCAAGSWCRRS